MFSISVAYHFNLTKKPKADLQYRLLQFIRLYQTCLKKNKNSSLSFLGDSSIELLEIKMGTIFYKWLNLARELQLSEYSNIIWAFKYYSYSNNEILVC